VNDEDEVNYSSSSSHDSSRARAIFSMSRIHEILIIIITKYTKEIQTKRIKEIMRKKNNELSTILI
jgi:hypothetical protein